ncbi:MAG: peptidylprolyl isomerase [Planctomycetota bacterium]
MRSNETSADLPVVKLTTTQGDIVLELYENEAPNTVANFINLVENGFYNDIEFHRVREGFMAQSGCPEGNGQGGPGYTIACECRTPGYRRHFTGVISMANTGAPDSGGSQFFLTFEQTSGLDGLHTVFGRVIEGGDVLDMITRTHTAPTQPRGPEPEIPGVVKDKIISAEVVSKRDHEYVPVTIGGDPISSANDQDVPAGDAGDGATEGDASGDSDEGESADDVSGDDGSSDEDSGDEASEEGSSDDSDEGGESEAGEGGEEG